MNLSIFKDMLHDDAVSAGYGVVSANLRKTTSKILGTRGVGQFGMNVLSIAAGMGLSQVNNPHVKIIGSALRISGIASMANSVIDRVISRKETDSK